VLVLCDAVGLDGSVAGAAVRPCEGALRRTHNGQSSCSMVVKLWYESSSGMTKRNGATRMFMPCTYDMLQAHKAGQVIARPHPAEPDPKLRTV
jgi:hypothetical protein